MHIEVKLFEEYLSINHHHLLTVSGLDHEHV